jgi:hypothetical protein
MGVHVRHDEWTERELEVLREHVGQERWFQAVQPHMNGRTEGSIRNRMARMREEHDVRLREPCIRDVENNWVASARRASQMLAEATLRVGTWA